VTSRGLYELHLNGQRVGDQLFTPGWTSLNKRLQYQTYDVTALLTKGANVAGAVLGSGWYRGEIGWGGHRNHYGRTLALLAQIDILYKDGRRETIGTDASWKAATGPILMSEIYAGETYDARLEKPGWTRPGFDDGAWRPVTVSTASAPPLIAPAGPPVRRIEELRPVRIPRTPAGLAVVDMGQNMVGWIRLKVNGPAGTTVTLRHAEVLDKAGNFYTENLRNAAATVRYTLAGGGTCRPTARSATSGSAGPATRRSSRARPPSTWTSPASSRSGWATSPPTSSRAAACPSSCRTCSAAKDAKPPGQRPGATPP
jgi:alpha-L-rhamnosidase